jgi:hypothetical protein
MESGVESRHAGGVAAFLTEHSPTATGERVTGPAITSNGTAVISRSRSSALPLLENHFAFTNRQE